MAWACACTFGTGGDFLQIAFQRGQAVQLLQAQGGGRGGIFGTGAKAIPAPEVAVTADQTLPRLQIGLQAGAIGAIHQPDLPHAAQQNTGGLHVV